MTTTLAQPVSAPASPTTAPVLRIEGAAWLASDLHLGEHAPVTQDAFLSWLEMASDQAAAVLLPGDIFEAWVGDDAIASPAPWLAAVLAGLKAAATRTELWLGHGNRDFLMGERLARAVGARLLPAVANVRTPAGAFLLCHGDELCTDDHAYQAFRQQVRQPAWQAAFLAKPLAEREAIVAGLRQDSRDEKAGKTDAIMDVNAAAVDDMLRTHGATRLVHGHTHRPDRHVFMLDDRRCERWVLPDWDADHQPVRGGWLLADEDGFALHEIELAS